MARRSGLRWAIVGHGGVAVILALAAVGLGLTRGVAWPLVVGPLAAVVYLAVALRRPIRRWRAARRPFPEAWREVLETHVRFYRLLDPGGRRRFERNLVRILVDHDFEAVAGAELDDEVRVLAAAGGAVLIHGMDGVSLPTTRTVLIYPDHFDDGYDVAREADILGQVHRQGPIIFSLRALRQGWAGGRDGVNVALHEFAHVLDLEDGFADGVPALAVGRIAAWDALIREELERVRRGRSALRPYAGTNQAELFAVAVEVFFERPEQLARSHRELFQALEALFGLDPRAPRDAGLT